MRPTPNRVSCACGDRLVSQTPSLLLLLLLLLRVLLQVGGYRDGLPTLKRLRDRGAEGLETTALPVPRSATPVGGAGGNAVGGTAKRESGMDVEVVACPSTVSTAGVLRDHRRGEVGGEMLAA
jgi:hypothetical protein